MPEDCDAILSSRTRKRGRLSRSRSASSTTSVPEQERCSLSPPSPFLGGIVLQGKAPHEWLSWASIAVFLGVVAITPVLLVPLPAWRLSISATTIIEGYAEGEYPRGLATTHRYLALQLEGADTRNAGRLNHLYWWFIAASGLLGAEVLLWLVVLIGR
jgi:hypothetical protein